VAAGTACESGVFMSDQDTRTERWVFVGRRFASDRTLNYCFVCERDAADYKPTSQLKWYSFRKNPQFVVGGLYTVHLTVEAGNLCTGGSKAPEYKGALGS